jgi:tRNA(Ile2) C34 agmatinyltransferase TiaS
MARMRCPHCDTPNTDETVRGDRLDYRCRHCGEFSIRVPDMEDFRQRRSDAKEARFVQRDDGRRYLVPEL